MAVVSAEETWEGRDGTESLDGRGVLVRTYKRVWRVLTDDALTGQLEVINAVGVPAMWAIYATDEETDLGARVVERMPKQDTDDPWLWLVEVKYSSKWQDEAAAVANPLERPSKISWQSVDFQEAVEVDEEGTSIINSAYEPYDPPVLRDAGRLTCAITKNLSEFDPVFYAGYLKPAKASNDGTFLGFEAGQVKILKVSCGEQQYENEVSYYPVRIEFDVLTGYWDEEEEELLTWDRYLLDQGYSTINLDTLKQQPILEAGQPVAKPRLLDGEGQLLDASADPAWFLGPFVLHPRKDFDALDIL